MSTGYIILRKENVNLFRLPQVNVGKGHFLDSWKDKIWRGELIIKTDSDFLTVEFVNYDGSIYSKAKIPQNYSSSIEKCTDSSRGYAIKITNESDGRFAWSGLVFHDRNSAFDFYVTFEEQLKRKQRVANPVEINANLNFGHKKGNITRHEDQTEPQLPG